jgi:hypothetical protein
MGLALLGIERGRVDGLVLGEQAFVGSQAGPERGDAGHGLVVGGAQLGRIGHGVQVSDGAPGAPETLGGDVQHLRDGEPIRRELRCGHGLQRGFRFGEEGIDGGRDVLGPDPVEERQVGEVEKRIGHGVHGGHLAPRCGKFKSSGPPVRLLPAC